MLNLDDIMRDYDNTHNIIYDNRDCDFKELYQFLRGYNLMDDGEYKQFDFADGCYIYTIGQYKDEKLHLSKYFTIIHNNIELEFERS